MHIDAHGQRSRILIFNCTSGRNAESLLGSLINVFKAKKQGSKLFDHVIFCTNTTYSSGQSKGGTYTPAKAPSADTLMPIVKQN